MLVATFRFYAELNDFLPPTKRQRSFDYHFDVPGSVKDAIEAIGVPHPEVDLILANGESVNFAYRVQPADQVSVFPIFESLDIGSLVQVRPEPLRVTRFVLDVHLGRLATYLRMFGFDALYRNNYDDEELAHISSSQRRILLTRDRGLLKRSIVTHGYCLRTSNPRQQLVELLKRFDLAASVKPFSRCMRCSGLLQPVDKSTIIDNIDAETQQFYHEFSRCQACGQIYWKGSHFKRMQEFIKGVLEEL